MTTTDSLPCRSFQGNWNCKEAKEPQYLVLGMGASLSPVAATTASTIERQKIPEIRVAAPREVKRFPGSVEAVRVLRTHRGVHCTATDIVLSRQGEDLFVQLKVQSRTWLRYLKFALYGTLFVVLWCFAYGYLYSHTGIFDSIVNAIIREYSDSNPRAVFEAQKNGVKYDETTRRFIQTSNPITVAQVMGQDPQLVMRLMGTLMVILAGAIALLLRFLPPQFLRIACRIVGWPTVEEFESQVIRHAVWVEGQLSTVLRDTFGVTEDRIIRVK